MRILSQTALFTMLLAIFTGTAWAKLPPPTPEEQAKAAAAKQKAAEDAEKAKALLEKAQDRVVQVYRSQHPAGSKSRGASTDERTEVPAAALNSRPLEKAGAYSEAVTPQSAGGASQGTAAPSAAAPQHQSPR